MDTKVDVKDKDIKVSKSNFAVYDNEELQYKGKINKLKMKDVIVYLQRDPKILNADGYAILQAISELNFTTSRQVTEYLNVIKNIDISQTIVRNKLEIFSKYSIISKYAFINPEKKEGTNMKVYTLDHNASILLRAEGFKCNWQHTELLNSKNAKNYLIRNQYIIKMFKDHYDNIENLKIKKMQNGIGAIYDINNIAHIVIPFRNNNEFDYMIKVFKSINMDADVLSRNVAEKKIILIGEDVPHSFKIYSALYSNKLITDKCYFTTDLRLYDENFNDTFFRFGIRMVENTPKVELLNTVLSELQ